MLHMNSVSLSTLNLVTHGNTTLVVLYYITIYCFIDNNSGCLETTSNWQ